MTDSTSFSPEELRDLLTRTLIAFTQHDYVFDFFPIGPNQKRKAIPQTVDDMMFSLGLEIPFDGRTVEHTTGDNTHPPQLGLEEF